MPYKTMQAAVILGKGIVLLDFPELNIQTKI